MEFLVNREAFLTKLELCQYGLSRREVVDQCSSFIFRNGGVYSYNDEVSCRAKSLLGKEFTAAVPAFVLMSMLKKFSEEEIRITATDSDITIHGKNRKSKHRIDKEIFLPIDKIERPTEWRDIHPEFNTAISIVQESASNDPKQQILTSIHVAPNYIEATDSFQIARYQIKTGVSKAFTVRKDSIKNIVGLDMTEIAETPNWVHFKSPVGVTFSCRRYVEPFPDYLGKFLEDDGGIQTVLPKGLSDAAERAQEFSKENADDAAVHIDIREGRIRVRGIGTSGEYEEVKSIKYAGPKVSFRIAPLIFAELVKRHNECAISAVKIRVVGQNYVYCASLEKASEEKS